MDVMMSAPVAGAPSPDTPCAPSADATDAFAALLDEAAGKGTDAPSHPSDHDEAADDMAAVVAASLMAIVPLTTPIVVKACSDAAAPPSESEAVGSIDSLPSASASGNTDAQIASLGDNALTSLEIPVADVGSLGAVAETKNQVPVPTKTGAAEATDDRAMTAPDAIALDDVQTTKDLSAALSAASDAAADVMPRNTAAASASKALSASHHQREAPPAESNAPSRGFDRLIDPTAASPVAQAAQTAESQAPEARTAGTTAARFARALERASAQVSPETQAVAPTSTDGATTGQNGSPQDGQTRGQSTNVDRGTVLTTAARVDTSPHAPTFTVPTAGTIELRSGSAIEGLIARPDGAALQIPEQEIVAQLIQSMRVQFRDGVGEAVVHLKPEHLGTISISLRIENGAVSASIHAGVPEVRQWLESQQTQLRDSLADQGLRLERFVVEPDGKRESADEQSDRGQARRRRPHARRVLRADEPVFEVLA